MLSAAIPNQIEERIGKTFLAVLSTAPAIAKPIPASPIAPSQPKKLSKIGGLLSSKTGNGAGNKNPMNANRESANQRKNAPAKPANMIPTMGAHLLITDVQIVSTRRRNAPRLVPFLGMEGGSMMVSRLHGLHSIPTT